MIRTWLLATSALALVSTGAFAAGHQLGHKGQNPGHYGTCSSACLVAGLQQIDVAISTGGFIRGIVHADASRQGHPSLPPHGDGKPSKTSGSNTFGSGKFDQWNTVAGWEVARYSYASTYYTSTFNQAIAELMVGDGKYHPQVRTALEDGKGMMGISGSYAAVFIQRADGANGTPGSVLASGSGTPQSLIGGQNDCCVAADYQEVQLNSPVDTKTKKGYWISAQADPTTTKPTFMTWGRTTTDFSVGGIGDQAESVAVSMYQTYKSYSYIDREETGHGTTSTGGWVVFDGQEAGVAAALE